MTEERQKASEIPTAGIYTGAGASHSWTWFVETLERAGNIKMVFLEEDDFDEAVLSNIDILMIGGGDVFGMASGIGPGGGTGN